MDPVLIAVVAVLCQYPVAIMSLIKLFGMKKEKNVTVIWNVIIIIIPFLGAAAFWIYYLINKKKSLKYKTSLGVENDALTDKNILSSEEAAEETARKEQSADGE